MLSVHGLVLFLKIAETGQRLLKIVCGRENPVLHCYTRVILLCLVGLKEAWPLIQHDDALIGLTRTELNDLSNGAALLATTLADDTDTSVECKGRHFSNKGGGGTRL